MKDAQQGLIVYIVGSDGREYELILKRMPVNKPRKPAAPSERLRCPMTSSRLCQNSNAT